jgi:hypothetical protein
MLRVKETFASYVAEKAGCFGGLDAMQLEEMSIHM